MLKLEARPQPVGAVPPALVRLTIDPAWTGQNGFDGVGSGGGAPASRPVPNEPPAGYDMDEEPF